MSDSKVGRIEHPDKIFIHFGIIEHLKKEKVNFVLTDGSKNESDKVTRIFIFSVI